MIVSGETVVVLDNEMSTKDKVYFHLVRFLAERDAWDKNTLALTTNEPQFFRELLDIMKPVIYNGGGGAAKAILLEFPPKPPKNWTGHVVQENPAAVTDAIATKTLGQ